MTKPKPKTAPNPETDALLAVRASCAPLALSCTAMSLMTPPAEERDVWQRSREEIIDALVLTDRRLDKIRTMPAEIGGSVPAPWIATALDAVATVGGVARIHEARYGATAVSRRLAEEFLSSRSALAELDELHRRRAGRAPLLSAEDQALLVRAARRAIRERDAAAAFDVGIANVPSYVVRPAPAIHTIRVTPRWREAVRALGTAAPLGSYVLLDGWPDERSQERWHIVVARCTLAGKVYVEELSWRSLRSRRSDRRSDRVEAARRASQAAA
ncbi:hypothetical protein [Methylorubrum extorquens]|uniref:hypothetical protein n=1 Tax=Methylorubrum extorquens TaxID=408 RepID=UPI00209C899D|nr:hypothetical protein [Methylorubrum extorquens]MCP1539783.1 hypothetical protein [Methylorubrum extorquens]